MSAKHVIVFLSSSAIFTWCAFLFGAPSYEGDFADATLAYHSKRYQSALQSLNWALKTHENEPKLLELKALVFKGMGREESAVNVYQKLIELGYKKNLSQPDVAPYFFELGVLHYKMQQFDLSRDYFLDTLNGNFNEPASHFFLGTMDYRQQRWYRAQPHFREVIEGDVTFLKPVAHLRLAEISNFVSDAQGTVRNYLAARELASSQVMNVNYSTESRQMAQYVVEESDRILKQVDQSIFYGSLTTSTFYDSNVLFTPGSAIVPEEGPSGRGSFKQLLGLSLGYASSPAAGSQFATSYRATGNYNFNSGTQSGQYLSNRLSFLLTWDPVQRTSYGVKVSGDANVRYILNPAANSRSYRLFNLSGRAGPFVRYQWNAHWKVGGELLYAYRYFPLDEESPANFRRSGNEVALRFFGKRSEIQEQWNPGVFLTAKLRTTLGSEYDAVGSTLDLNNTFYLTETMWLDGTASIGYYRFANRSGAIRQDFPFELRASAKEALTDSVDLSADVSFTRNFSNVPDPYEFSRYQIGLGLEYQI